MHYRLSCAIHSFINSFTNLIHSSIYNVNNDIIIIVPAHNCTRCLCRGVAVGIHYSHTAEACQRAALLVQCNIIVVNSAEDLAKVLQIQSNLPDLQAIVQYGKGEGLHETPGVMTVSDALLLILLLSAEVAETVVVQWRWW